MNDVAKITVSTWLFVAYSNVHLNILSFDEPGIEWLTIDRPDISDKVSVHIGKSGTRVE